MPPAPSRSLPTLDRIPKHELLALLWVGWLYCLEREERHIWSLSDVLDSPLGRRFLKRWDIPAQATHLPYNAWSRSVIHDELCNLLLNICPERVQTIWNTPPENTSTDAQRKCQVWQHFHAEYLRLLAGPS